MIPGHQPFIMCDLEKKLLIFAGIQCESPKKEKLGVSSVPSNHLSNMILQIKWFIDPSFFFVFLSGFQGTSPDDLLPYMLPSLTWFESVLQCNKTKSITGCNISQKIERVLIQE